MSASIETRWTTEQDETMRQLYPTLGPTKLAGLVSRSVPAVNHRAMLLGLKFIRKFTWTKELEQVVRDRYKTDGPNKLADEFGTTPWSVVAKSRRLGIGSTNKYVLPYRWTPEAVEIVKQRYASDGGEAVAKAIGASINVVQKFAGRLGLHTIAGHAVAGRKRAERNNSCNTRYFDQWSENMAYILGFLFADGNVNSKMTAFTVVLSTRDEIVLQFIKKELQSRQTIYQTPGRFNEETGRTSRPQCRLVIGSTIIAESLGRRGMHPRKTVNDDPFPDVPDEMIPHFIRGLLDGDGCVHVSVNGSCEVSIVGSLRMMQGTIDALHRLAGMKSVEIELREGKTTNYGVVSWSSIDDLRRFHQFIYPEGFEFCLERKHSRLADWLSVPRFTPRVWDAFEEEMVRRFFYCMRPIELAALLNKSVGAVVMKAKTLGIAKQKNRSEQL